MVMTNIGWFLSVFFTKAEISMETQDVSCKVQKRSSRYLKKERMVSYHTPWKSWSLTPGMIGYSTQKPAGLSLSKFLLCFFL